jgi:hypothetical protein
MTEITIEPSVTAVELTVPPAVTVAVTPAVPAVTVSAEPASVVVDAAPIAVTVSPLGVQGPPGPAGGGAAAAELYDGEAPATPADTYLRFVRDLDGDVQTVYLGTVD